MDFKDKKSKTLFSRFAYSCASKKISRGEITEDYARSMIGSVRRRKDIPEEALSYFTVALKMCQIEASNQDVIDRDSILRYFLSNAHDKVVESSHKIHGDFDKEECKARIVKVSGVKGEIVNALFDKKPKDYRNIFSIKVKEGDFAVTHAGSIVERLTRKEAEKYSRLRSD